MSEPATQPGWYPDPWQRAERRWHDGRRWTEHVDGDAAPAPGPFVDEDANADQAQARISPDAAMLLAMAASPRERARTSGRATAALVTGLFGVPIVPIVLGVLARRQIAQSNGSLTGGGLAITGIVLGLLNLLLLAVMWLVVLPATLQVARDVRAQFPAGVAGLSSPVDAARAAQAQAQLRLVTTAMETCAATSDSGGYGGCDARLVELAPQLADALARCGAAGGTCVSVPDEQTFVVRVTDAASTRTTWTETHASGGQVTPGCEGPACGAMEAMEAFAGQ